MYRASAISLALLSGALVLGCGSPRSPSRSAGDTPTTQASEAARPSAAHEHAIATALLTLDDLPLGNRGLWVAETAARRTSWDRGPCGSELDVSPVETLDISFEEATPAGVTRSQPTTGWIKQSVLALAPGGATRYLASVDAAADGCHEALQLSHSGALSKPRLPGVSGENAEYSVERFSCCATPADPGAPSEPHDIAYVRNGDLVAVIASTADAAFEPAVVLVSSRLNQP